MAFDPLSNIRPKSGINKIFEYEFLNPNLWDFSFEDNSDTQFLIQNVTLPFIKFETETRNIGTKILKSVSPEEAFSITFYETSDFAVQKYMLKWMDDIFDKKERKFRTYKPSSVTFINGIKQSSGYVRNGILSTYKYIKPNIFVPAFTEPTMSWKFSGLMLTGIDNQDWDYEGTSGKQITCQFTVDTVDKL